MAWLRRLRRPPLSLVGFLCLNCTEGYFIHNISQLPSAHEKGLGKTQVCNLNVEDLFWNVIKRVLQEQNELWIFTFIRYLSLIGNASSKKLKPWLHGYFLQAGDLIWLLSKLARIFISINLCINCKWPVPDLLIETVYLYVTRPVDNDRHTSVLSPADI